MTPVKIGSKGAALKTSYPNGKTWPNRYILHSLHTKNDIENTSKSPEYVVEIHEKAFSALLKIDANDALPSSWTCLGHF